MAASDVRINNSPALSRSNNGNRRRQWQRPHHCRISRASSFGVARLFCSVLRCPLFPVVRRRSLDNLNTRRRRNMCHSLPESARSNFDTQQNTVEAFVRCCRQLFSVPGTALKAPSAVPESGPITIAEWFSAFYRKSAFVSGEINFRRPLRSNDIMQNTSNLIVVGRCIRFRKRKISVKGRRVTENNTAINASVLEFTTQKSCHSGSDRVIGDLTWPDLTQLQLLTRKQDTRRPLVKRHIGITYHNHIISYIHYFICSQ